jgi:hypothetical protein
MIPASLPLQASAAFPFVSSKVETRGRSVSCTSLDFARDERELALSDYARDERSF